MTKTRRNRVAGVDAVVKTRLPQTHKEMTDSETEDFVEAGTKAIGEAFRALGGLLDRRRLKLCSPIMTRVIDSNGVCIWTIEMSGQGDDWKSRVVDFNIPEEGTALPLFLAAEDSAGATVKVRLESDDEPLPS